jgi:hypothetical protein
VTRLRVRSRLAREGLVLALTTEYPDALTTLTGRVVRTELTGRDIARAAHRHGVVGWTS